MITVVSSISDDSDALVLALEKLKEKGYSTIMVGDSRKALVS